MNIFYGIAMCFMNFIISLSVLFAFVTVFSSLWILDDMTTFGIEDHPFFSSELTEKPLIFLIGSSHVSMLNVTYMNNILSQQNLDYTVFNLSYDGDKPSIRIHNYKK